MDKPPERMRRYAWNSIPDFAPSAAPPSSWGYCTRPLVQTQAAAEYPPHIARFRRNQALGLKSMVDERSKIIEMSTTLSQELLAEIGRVTVQFALLEYHVRELVHWLLNRPPSVAAVITSELSFRSLYQLASALIKEQLPELSVDFKDVLKAIVRAEGRRNQIVHSLWGSAGPGLIIRTKYSAKTGRGLHLSREEMTADDLYRASSLMSVAAYDVDAFYAKARRDEA